MSKCTVNLLDDAQEISTYLKNRRTPLPAIGTKFHRLSFTGIVRVSHLQRKNRPLERIGYLQCECECGSVGFHKDMDLKTGNSKSCGCLAKEITSERRKSDPLKYTRSVKKYHLYHVWQQMHYRCEKSTDKKWERYGARGIRVCEEWSDFGAFEQWSLSHGYQRGLTIERTDGDKGYNPENCIFADYATQNRNTSRNQNVTAFGETKCLTDWVNDPRTAVTSQSTYQYRVKQGLTAEQSLMAENKKRGAPWTFRPFPTD